MERILVVEDDPSIKAELETLLRVGAPGIFGPGWLSARFRFWRPDIPA